MSEQTPYNNDTIDQLTLLFGAMSDPTRATLLLSLLTHDRKSGDLANAVGVSQSAVSHQLRWLRENNIVTARRQGREIYYTLADDCIRDIIHVALRHITETHPSQPSIANESESTS